MEIIGLLGHQGVGKNYIAEFLMNNILDKKPTLIVAFADHFKIDCVCKHNIEYEKVFYQKDNITRKKLQKIGTEDGRNKYGENIWINVTKNWMKTYHERGIKRFIIADVRFQNEVDWIKSENGTIIKINAPNRYLERVMKESNNNPDEMNKIVNHISEKGIDEIKNFDFEVNNDPDEDISKQLTEYMGDTWQLLSF